MISLNAEISAFNAFKTAFIGISSKVNIHYATNVRTLKRYVYLCIMAKEKKKRADHYETKLAVKGEFIDVINASLGLAKKESKPKEKKKKG